MSLPSLSALSSLSSLSFMPALVNAIGWALIHFLWQGFLVGGVSAVLLLLLRNASPQARYATGCGALLICFFLPLFEAASRFQESAGTTLQLTSTGVKIDATLREFDLQQLLFWLQSHLHGIVLIWLLCVALLSIRMALGLLWLRSYRQNQHSRPHAQWQARLTALAGQFGLPHNAANNIILRVVDDLESPITIGWLRPLVLVPAALITGMPPPLLEALLAHELAHISRFDYLINLIQNLIEMLLFFHPAVWWISKRIRIEREQIADDIAARILGEPRRLALALQELALCRFSHNQLAQAANGGNLMSRIKRLVRPEVQSLSWKAAVSVIGLTVACISLYAHASATDALKTKASVQTQANSKPKIDMANCERPAYPPESITKNEKGVVELSFLVGETGRILKSKVEKSSGFPALDEAATAALMKCKAAAGTKNGKAQQAWVKIAYDWNLE